jgi:hypothetical protein
MPSVRPRAFYLLDPNGYPGEYVLVDPAEPEDLADRTVLNLDNGCVKRPDCEMGGTGKS